MTWYGFDMKEREQSDNKMSLKRDQLLFRYGVCSISILFSIYP